MFGRVIAIGDHIPLSMLLLPLPDANISLYLLNVLRARRRARAHYAERQHYPAQSTGRCVCSRMTCRDLPQSRSSIVQTTGPMFETVAESKLLHQLGTLGTHVVGMTGANQAMAARESSNSVMQCSSWSITWRPWVGR